MKNEIVYKYLDTNIKVNREKVLKNYLEKQEYSNELSFYDLNMYENKDDLKNNISKIIYKSKLDKNITLTKYQVEILNILQDNNIFLSAPTSFGKTFIMLEFIKRNIDTLKNIVFIIPTISLMNELLKKIYDNFGDEYNICINSEEAIEEKNIFVFVPERSNADFIEITKKIDIDFLVFDEIYKLQGTKKELRTDDRLIYMNKVYLELVKISKKIALLGPYINSVEFSNTNIDIIKFYTNYMPVYNEINVLEENKNWKDEIKFDNQLIYFRTPQSIYKNIDDILSKIPENDYYIQLYNNEIDFLKNNIGEEWYVIDLLKRGIGIHHGKTPMFLRKFYENEYNKKNIKILLCTDTLMEGINTPTESLLIVDNPGSAFKLNNLIGRVGRLNPKKPVIGNVTICNKEILQDLININSWLDLKIRAEDEEVLSDDEVLYLNKQYSNEEKNNQYKEKIDLLKERYNIVTEEIVNNNLELDKVLKLFNQGIINELENSQNVYQCIVAATKLIPGPSYIFNKDRFINLNLQINYLPYKTYINDILNRKSFREIIKSFNTEFNTSGNVENINLFIDALYNLNNFIKFKFSKIINYINITKNDITNDSLKTFISLLTTFNKLETSYKILDDLGIANDDAQKIIQVLNLDNNISASKMMKILKDNKIKLIREINSPFSKNNIESI